MHLKKKCMKNSSPVDIEVAVKEAKECTVEHLKHGSVFKYEVLRRMFDEENRVKVIQLLLSNGCFVSGQPPVQDLPLCEPPQDPIEEPIEVVNENDDDELHQVCKKQRLENDISKSSIRDCHIIFEVAQKDFFNVMESLKMNKDVTTKQMMLVLFYLEAVLLLKYLKKPQIIKALLVTEWLDRKHHQTVSGERFAIVTINAAEHHKAQFALNNTEEKWFQEYFSKMRPKIVSHQDLVDFDMGDKFFVSPKSSEIYDPAAHIKSLFKKYKLPNVKRKNAVKEFKKAISPLNYMGEQSRDAAYAYLEKAKVSKKHPCSEMTLDDLCLASMLLGKVADPLANSVVAASHRYKEMDETAALQAFLQECPVTINGKPPLKKIRERLVGSHELYCYQKWRLIQKDMRKKETLKHFTRRKPSKQCVTRYFQQMEWTKNLPPPEEVVSGWHPVGKEINMGQISSLVETQSWRGLHVIHDEVKGRKVITTQTFQKGDVICDYHGMVRAAEEGKRMMTEMEEEMGYLFFFQDPSGKKLCVDAKTLPCSCHPTLDTVGRLINHSKKRFNIKPNRVRLDIFGSSQFVILFTALRDIDVEEELLFDYGVTTKSFGGEGAELEWLDNS